MIEKEYILLLLLTTMFTRIQHPGLTLLDYLEDRGLSQKKFAELIGKSPVEVNYIIKGKSSINVDYAIRFSLVFGNRPEIWLRLQQLYDIAMLQQSEKQTEYDRIEQRVSEFAFA